MSLDLGHSKGYIQSITSGRAMPSMSEFLYICEYFGITPQDFFDEEKKDPSLVNDLLQGLYFLDRPDLILIKEFIDRLNKK